MPTVAVTDDFLEALEQLPRKAQRKVRAFVSKFQNNPTSSALNYEPIQADDARVRTVRIDKTYRGIVLHPEKGDLYLLTHVGHHDKAMAWARHKRFDIHARTGALQVYTAAEVDPPAEAPAAAPAAAPQAETLFSAYGREEIFELGVPEVLVPAVLALEDESQLDALAPNLPDEASEALYGLAAGMPLADVMAEVERLVLEPGDVAGALKHPDTQRRVMVVENEDALQAMLEAPWAKWRVFLHPTQRKLVTRHYNGPAKVTGGAGTGKTVVAVHRAAHLARTVYTQPRDRILMLTYTKNLAQGLKQQLDLLDASLSERVTVRNLHSLAHEYLRTSGMTVRPLKDQEAHEHWEDALGKVPACDRDAAFLQSEYEDVVLAQGIRTEEEYRFAKRTGRSGRLSRQQRGPLWEVMMHFAEHCECEGAMTYSMMVDRASDAVKTAGSGFRSVVVDEGQDLTQTDWRFVRALVPEGPNDIFLVGDAHQRIYGKPVVLSHCGIETRGRSRRLRVNYRTTQEIRRWACGILEGQSFDDLDGEAETQDGYTSLLHGHQPELVKAKHLDEHLQHAAAHIQALLEQDVPAATIACTASTHADCDRVLKGLSERGIKALKLEKTLPADHKEGVRIGTMHRLKGLEFRHLFLFAETDPRGGLEDVQTCCTHYVAATRARDTLTIYVREGAGG
jgi:superfamily I DNA/RNA helicase/mRNA-degrading endonuclease RelE of RelBE toxin-antitoxin system